MMVHLAAERALNQRLLQRHGRGVDGLGRHRAVAELLKQLGGNRRQVYRWGLGFARHIFSWGASYALNTKFLTDPKRSTAPTQRRINRDDLPSAASPSRRLR